MTEIRYAEIQSIETVDGQRLTLKGEFYEGGFVNYGMPRVEYITQRGYRQNGETVRDFLLGSRSISLRIFTLTNLDRDDYWRERARLFDIFRPNRGDNRLNELTLTIRRADRTTRSIKCFYNGGLELQDQDTDDNAFKIDATVNLLCPSPIWLGEAITPTFTEGSDGGFKFPITFPITFSAGGFNRTTGNLDYNGSWRAYPTITLTGQYTTASVQNSLTGATIELLTSIGAGEQRIITLSETGFSVVDGAGGNKFEELSPTSDLVGFFIKPQTDSESQAITGRFVGGVEGQTSISMTYQESYIGI